MMGGRLDTIAHAVRLLTSRLGWPSGVAASGGRLRLCKRVHFTLRHNGIRHFSALESAPFATREGTERARPHFARPLLIPAISARR